MGSYGADKNTALLADIEALKKQNDDLQASFGAAELQVGKLGALKEKLNAEISEKTLQVRLQIDQINDLKHEHELSRKKEDIAKAEQIPKLEALIEQFKQQQMASESAKRDGLELQVEELTLMLKSLSDQVKQKGKT